MTRLALAVDLGGTKVEAALVGEDGTVVAQSRTQRPTGRRATPDDVTAGIDEAIGGALRHLGDDRLIGAGVGAAGPMNLQTQAVSPVNMRGLVQYPIGDAVSRHVPGLPVTVRLDGTCIALAEQLFGAARGSRHSLSMVVSTGVGGGIVSGGRLLAGATGNAGHLGQVRLRGPRIDAEGDGTGNGMGDGTVEAIASGPASVAWAVARGWHGATGEDLARDVATGDAVATAAVRRSAAAVGEAIAIVSTLLDLQVAVVAGGFVNVTPDYLDLVRAGVRDAAVLEYAAAVRVEPSGLSGTGPLAGAAALVLRPDLLAD
ncbi:ROK family protein [uncultured Amnibacterium sp.]|uniref:ROK family protein n=1 Tax=uncultured Amnibacterium sp. TaxID=1631851 RepID=UPI0035C9FB29